MKKKNFLRFPFDWKNPFGYFIAVIFEYIVTVNAFILGSAMIPFGLGAFLIALAALEEARDDLKKINDSAKLKENQLETLTRLGNFTQIHGRLMQLSTFSRELANYFKN